MSELDDTLLEHCGGDLHEAGDVGALDIVDGAVGLGAVLHAGGVATSGLEMTQNAAHLPWQGSEVDEKLHIIMKSIHEQCVKFGRQADGKIDYVKGANIAGFMKVATAMVEQGVI